MGDVDATNCFHQWPLSECTQNLLATTWGLVSSKFLPEGISPAMGYMQIYLYSKKFEIFLKRCKQHNLILKYLKAWLGCESINFFGYKVKFGTYEHDESRKKAIMDCEMSVSVQGMQSFLGAALFSKNHVPSFSEKAHRLHKITQKTFDWNRSTRQEDQEEDFKVMKQALAAR